MASLFKAPTEAKIEVGLKAHLATTTSLIIPSNLATHEQKQNIKMLQGENRW